MKITFKDNITDVKGEILFVSVDFKNKDEIVKEDGIKTLYLKREEAPKMNLRKLFLLLRKMVALAKNTKAKKIVFNFSDFKFKNIKLTTEELGEIIGTQLDFANYEFVEYKTPTEEGFPFIKEVVIEACPEEARRAILKGHTIAEEVNKTRTVANTPGGDMTPQILATKAKKAVKSLPVKVSILGEKEMERLNMRAILSVGRGSDEESKFIIMEYSGGARGDKPIVLVGKGVTFDAGGINLKPASSLLGMNMDMSGGAAVIHTVALVAKMKLKKNVIGLVPSVENMASGKSYRPGDVIRSMSGKTIEVLNTDAEGRVILADALTYAQKYKPEVVIDVATLTGAAGVKHPLTAKQKLFFYSSKVGKKIFSLPVLKSGEKYARKFLYKLVREKDYASASPRMKEIMKNVLAEDLADTLNKIIVPTVLIWGRNDHSTPLADGELMHKKIVNSKFFITKLDYMVKLCYRFW